MKKIKKSTMLLLLMMLMLSMCVVFAGAASEGISDFSVISDIDGKQIKVNWWQNNTKSYLFLPADADLSALTVDYTADSEVMINGEKLEDNSVIALETQKNYVLSCGGVDYVLEVMQSQGIASAHIVTESGSMAAVHADKSHKEKADIVIISDGEITVDKSLEYIKGRGNATWTYDKRPYNIKFDKKTDLFGMGKAKKWTLLANYVDKTVMRNHVALSLAETIGIDFTSKHVYIDLFIDDEYYGNYVLCESVEVGETRVDIFDLEGATEDANPGIELDECAYGGDHTANYRALVPGTQKWLQIPNNPEDISGGYLIEYELPDRYVNEVCGFVTDRNQTMVLKSPEYASEAQVKYISALYQEFEDAVYSETGYNFFGRHYTEYIDVESFAKMYILQEFTKNLDAAITSFYIYKDAGNDKFVAAPVWDFDRSLGDNFDRFGMNTATPDGWWAGIIYHWSDNAVKTLPTILNALYRQDDFFALASAEWNNTFAPVLTDDYINSLSDFADELTSSAVMNSIRWNNFETTDYESTAQSYKSYVKGQLLDFIELRRDFLNKGFSDASVRVFYNANGGSGNMYNEDAVALGETLTLPKCSFIHSGMIFDSWNTKEDGSGVRYNEGDSMYLTERNITLYAQWKEKPQPEPDSDNQPDGPSEEKLSFFEKILKFFTDFFDKIRKFFDDLF